MLDCDREVEKPPETLYIGLGWDEDSTTKRKHYRRFFNDELVDKKYLSQNPHLTEEQIDLLYQDKGVDKDYLARYPKLTEEQFMRFFALSDRDVVYGNWYKHLAQNPSINPDSEQVFTKGIFNWRW